MRLFKNICMAWAGALTVLLVAGCPVNPVKQAETFEQKAFALYGTYVIFQGKAAALEQDPTVPERIKQGLRDADKVTYPVAESLVDAAVVVSDIRDIIDVCGALPTPENNPACSPNNQRRLENAITNLSTIYFKAQPVILSMVATVKRAQ